MALTRSAPSALRLGVLLGLLALVCLWAWRDVRSRRERNAWERPLSIAVILVRQRPLDPDAVEAFRDRLPALDAQLAREMKRYRRAAGHPFAFTFIGPVDVAEPPPRAAGDTIVDAAMQTYARWRWTSRVDGAVGLEDGPYDSRIYVAARPPATEQRQMVEGESEEGGRVGTVEVELNASMADFALFVVAHELFHTVGATDKYDAQGNSLVPSGLADPSRKPRFPQERAEVMSRNRPIAPGLEEPPTSLEELGVGPATALEIGWIK